MRNHRTGPCPARHHTTPVAYSRERCTCPAAREAYRLYRKRLRENRQLPALVPAVGTARRLQALVAFGYTWLALENRLGLSRRSLRCIAVGTNSRVLRSTAENIALLFEELSATPGPSSYARKIAARHGWVPPLAWDSIDDPGELPNVQGFDEHAITAALAGEKRRLGAAEKAEVVRRAVDAGMPVARAAALAGMTGYGAQQILEGRTPSSYLAGREVIEAELLQKSGEANYRIAQRLGVHHQTVGRARDRLIERGLLLAA